LECDILSFLKDNKAQISAEMIIVMAALLAVAVVLITRLSSTSKNAAQKLGTLDTNLMDKINAIDYNADGNA